MGFNVEVDSRPLMNQLARMAGIPEGGFRRMVLVLDVQDAPRLYTEGFLNADKSEELLSTPLTVVDKPVVVNTTTMQNQKYASFAPMPRS